MFLGFGEYLWSLNDLEGKNKRGIIKLSSDIYIELKPEDIIYSLIVGRYVNDLYFYHQESDDSYYFLRDHHLQIVKGFLAFKEGFYPISIPKEYMGVYPISYIKSDKDKVSYFDFPLRVKRVFEDIKFRCYLAEVGSSLLDSFKEYLEKGDNIERGSQRVRKLV